MPNILHEADALTGGDRNRSYGNPRDNHARTARLWSAYLMGKYGFALVLDADDVCYLNILQKVSRSMCDSEHRDTWTDIAGYARNLEMMRLSDESPEPCD